MRRLPPVQRGLFRAALSYARMQGQIVNQRLAEMISGIAERIGLTIGQKIFRRGMERALGMLRNATARVFPAVRRWINSDSYIFWLGTDMLSRMSKWVFVITN